jgi:vancomycin permeability regulator SanA
MMLARVLAAFLGGFALLNLVGEACVGSFDANRWWIDPRALPERATTALLLLGSLSLLAWALRPRMSAWRRWITRLVVAALLVFAVVDALRFYALAWSGAIVPGVIVPLSALISGVLALILVALRHPEIPPTTRRERWLAAGGLAALLVAFPLAQMMFFGCTDYRRPADAIVVFGAGVYPDGRCSHALTDRMRTACDLHRAGHADLLVLSGGPGMGPVHETEGMRRLALELGVPAHAILLDPRGLNTRATVSNVASLLAGRGAESILAVSHAYHLPRVKLSCDRAGLRAFTVPARENHHLTKMPFYLAREVVALWYYYLRPLV